MSPGERAAASVSSAPVVTEQRAAAIVAAARRRAVELQAAVTVVVVDGGSTRAVLRMDGADILTIGLAAGKAKLAAANGVPTKRWRELIAADPFLGFTLPVAFDRLLEGAVLFAGGYPIRIDGRTIGAVGISGADEDQDDDIAAAGLAGLTVDEPGYLEDDDAV